MVSKAEKIQASLEYVKGVYVRENGSEGAEWASVEPRVRRYLEHLFNKPTKEILVANRIGWDVVFTERYCVDSGRPVARSGARCRRHAAASAMCYTSFRDPRCKHEHLSKNHPFPHCEDCGLSGRRKLK